LPLKIQIIMTAPAPKPIIAQISALVAAARRLMMLESDSTARLHGKSSG
jgi:hypothetical protein